MKVNDRHESPKRRRRIFSGLIEQSPGHRVACHLYDGSAG